MSSTAAGGSRRRKNRMRSRSRLWQVSVEMSIANNEGIVPNRVLVVDDERCIADTLAAILRNSGYDAAACYDADSALQEFESVAPDLVISDVVMPRSNGVELAMLIRERHPECKILLFSGQAQTVDMLGEARRRGHDFELLAKPIHPAELLSKLSA